MTTNSKFKIQNSKLNNAGFTLVELLVSIIVLVAVGSVVAGIITTSLRGTNKTNTIENIRQIGNYTLAQMSKNIEYSASFGGLSENGEDYFTSCPSTVPTPSVTPPPTITYYKYIKVTPLSSGPIVYSCTPSTVTSNGTSLIDTNSIAMTGCTISCVQTKSTDVPIIRIGFKLGPKNRTGLVESSSPPILFETSVIIRNYKK